MEILADIVKDTLSDFWERLKTIAVDGSGIPPRLWDANATPLSNFEIDTDGTVTHPLYDALGWHFARFSYAANDASKAFGVSLTDYRGDVWQLILPDDSARGYRYLAPKGVGNRAFFPSLDSSSIAKICARYGIDTPGDGADYWEYFKQCSIPLVTTEGAKKALAALGQGVLCVAVYGNACLRSPDLDGWQNIQIAMDQDSGFTSKGKDKRANTKASVASGAKYLRAKGVTISFILWDCRDGKGLDDLLINSPAKFWESINNPKDKLGSIAESIKDTGRYDHEVYTTQALEKLLQELQGIVCIDAPTGSGKTESLQVLTHDHNLSHIAVTPLRSLCHGVAKTLDLAVHNDSSVRAIDDRTAVVVNSAFKVRPLRDFNLYLDEFEQSLDSLYRGKLNRKGRAKAIEGFENHLKTAKRVILLSATALPKDIRKIEEITGQKVVKIRFNPDHGHAKAPIMVTIGNGDPGSSRTALNMGIAALESDIRSGLRAIVSTDTTGKDGAIGLYLMAKEWGLSESEILCYSQPTLTDPRVAAFQKAGDKGQWLHQHGIKLLIHSPIMQCGDSIKDPYGQKLFDCRYAFLSGKSIAPSQALQLINRYRSTTPINIVLSRRGSYVPLIRSVAGKRSENAHKLGLLVDRFSAGFKIDEYALDNDRRLDWEFREYGDAFMAWAERDGHTVEVDQIGDIPEITRLKLDDQIQEFRAKPIAGATPIDDARAKEIKAMPEPSINDDLSLKAWEIRKYHGLAWDDELTIEMVIDEGFGKGRSRFSRLLRLAVEGYARDCDRDALATLGDRPYLHDLPLAQTRLELWERLGILEIIAYCLKNPYSQNDTTLRAWWDQLSRYRSGFEQFPKLLGVTLPIPSPDDPYKGMVKTIGTLLKALGFETRSKRSAGEGRIRVYWVTVESIEEVSDRLARFLSESGLQARAIPLVKIILEGVALPKTQTMDSDENHPNGSTPKPDQPANSHLTTP